MNDIVPKFQNKTIVRNYDICRIRELEIDGERYGNLTAEEHVGFVDNESVWKFRCAVFVAL